MFHFRFALLVMHPLSFSFGNEDFRSRLSTEHLLMLKDTLLISIFLYQKIVYLFKIVLLH